VIQDDAPATATPPPHDAAASDRSFDAFFVAEFPRMVAFARALVGDRAIAEELAQEAMLRAFRNWDTVSNYERPGAWVRRVLANLASSARKRRGIETRAHARVDVRPEASEDVLVDPHDGFWVLVRALPTRQREAIALHYLEDWSVKQIAQFLGCAESTAKAHLQKARRRLAAALEADAEDR
jgi:RNA polymerase sigma-70 factor, ECF subfamily